MYFEKVELPKFQGYKSTASQKLLESFLDSGLECAKVCEWPHSTPYIAATALKKAASRFGLRVDVFVYGGDVYLKRR